MMISIRAYDIYLIFRNKFSIISVLYYLTLATYLTLETIWYGFGNLRLR